MKERHISQRKEGKRQNKKKVVEKKKKEEKVGTRIRRGLKASRRIKNRAKSLVFRKKIVVFYTEISNFDEQI